MQRVIRRRHPAVRAAVLAIAVGTIVITHTSAGSHHGQRPARTATVQRRDADVMPPILAPLSPRDLRALRRRERAEAAASAYRPPAGARYSLAEMNAYAGR